MTDAVQAAKDAATAYSELYEDSAKNLLGRTPNLMLLLSAYVAGKQDAEEPEQLF